jgi:hypothetical protein
MTDFFLQFGAFMTIATAIVVGGVAIFGIWDRKQRDRRKEVDGEEDRLIDILNKTVGELEKRVTKQDEDIRLLTKKVMELDHENSILIKVLQGRDEETQKFYKEAYEAMKVIHDSHDVLTTVAESMKITSSTIGKLIDLSSKQTDVIGAQK